MATCFRLRVPSTRLSLLSSARSPIFTPSLHTLSSSPSYLSGHVGLSGWDHSIPVFSSSPGPFSFSRRSYASGEKDYYQVLGVTRDATEKDIKKAFRKLAKEYHPDRNRGDKEKEKQFQQFSAAYDVLSDPEKRKKYDMVGHQAFSEGYSAQDAPDFEDILSQFGFGGGGSGFGGFEDIFGGAFGGGAGRSRQTARGKQGQNLEMSQTISFMEAVNGVKKEISYSTKISCDTCKGFGTKDAKRPPTCSSCGGSGSQTASQGGLFFVQQICSTCRGTGEMITDTCGTCSGKGTTGKRVNLEVSLPAGIDDQDTVRVPRKGCAGERGGPAGDLFITVRVQPHSYFKRANNDILLEVPLSLTQAVFGSIVVVPTVHGKNLEVNVKPGTQSGERSILRGKGISRKGRFDVGNQILTYKVLIPSGETLPDNQKDLFTQLQTLETKPDPFQLTTNDKE